MPEESRTAPSRGRIGTALDNATAESVIATIKRELTSRCRWPTRFDLELALVSYIGWYNARRRHRSLKSRRAGRTAAQAPLQVLEQYNHQAPSRLVPN
jgi:transposase InsO family protein